MPGPAIAGAVTLLEPSWTNLPHEAAWSTPPPVTVHP